MVVATDTPITLQSMEVEPYRQDHYLRVDTSSFWAKIGCTVEFLDELVLRHGPGHVDIIDNELLADGYFRHAAASYTSCRNN